ncbi:hypothetical protein ACFFRR_003200 [Megaselia abdita]
MDQVIRTHHELYLSVFQDNHLTAKFHLMLHYSMVVRLSGPLRNSMVFKFESKHQQLKEYARCCFSRKNIPLSICKKFCIEFAYILTQYKDRCTKVKDIKLKGSTVYAATECECKFVYSVRYKGTTFEIGNIITKDETNFKIEAIAVQEEKDRVFVRGRIVHTVLDVLGCVKLIDESNIYEEINLDSVNSSPVNVQSVNGSKYIILKH